MYSKTGSQNFNEDLPNNSIIITNLNNCSLNYQLQVYLQYFADEKTVKLDKMNDPLSNIFLATVEAN